MGSNQSTQNDTSLPSIYCEYSDKCPSRNRIGICIPCLYKKHTGTLRPQRHLCNNLCSNNPNLRTGNYPLVNGYCDECCRCSSSKLCGTCREFMQNCVFPPATSEDRLSLLKPYEADNNFAKF